MDAPVIVVGAGPVGLTAALLIADAGVDCLVVTQDATHCEGSRAIALHHSALQVWSQLGLAGPMMTAGVVWQTRSTYYRDRLLHVLELPPANGYPWWINLPQSELESLLATAARAHPRIDLREGSTVIGCEQNDRRVRLTVATHDNYCGTYEADYVVAADGAKSTLRQLCDLDFPGYSFADRFAILDIRADLLLPRQPRMIFDHPANPGRTTLIHPQPHGIWRVDFHLGHPARFDPVTVDHRLVQLLDYRTHQVVWSSTYRFHQRLLPQLRHGRIFFAGDAAHLVAPFGARGLNSGIQDAACLAPRLTQAIKRAQTAGVLASYHTQRWPSLLRDQTATSTTMRFMAPQTAADRWRQRAVLQMACYWPAARKWVDSGRMYAP
jgi:3-(3-hydroxy-phenyl)propionate hydroxylase